MIQNKIFVGTLILMLAVGITCEARNIVLSNFGYPQNQAVNSNRELLSFGSCLALKAHIKQNLSFSRSSYRINSMNRKFSQSELCNSCGPTALNDSSTAGASLEVGASSQLVAKNVVGTNNQVTNVDEADFVKFDGKNIYQIHQGALKIIKAWPANDLKELSITPIKGVAREMLFYQQNIVIIANSDNKLEATIYDVSTPSAPRELTRFAIPGQYLTARLVGSTVRIASRDNQTQFWRVTTPPPAAEIPWLELDTNSGELDIPPTIQTTQSQVRTLDTIKNCESIYVPHSGIITNLTRLITIDLEARRYNETMAFINPAILYFSDSSIFLSENSYEAERDYTLIKSIVHKFDISQTNTIPYAATGVVNGSLINQFAMDEHKGKLRVATNGSELIGKYPWSRSKTMTVVSRVQILSQVGKELKVIGKTENLARGERIYSVRFDGDKGYLVTFRQVDPLFTLDLSNPRHPKAVGELKIPGFSTYIHILDSSHLLTIGQDADPLTGRAKGIKLSVFDTTDFKNPKEVKSLFFKAQTQSEATYEHKAFSFNREKGALAIPVADGQRSALLIFKVNPHDIQFKGEMTMTEMFSHINISSIVRRSFFADDIVYAIGGVGIKAAKIFAPGINVGTLVFGPVQLVTELEW